MIYPTNARVLIVDDSAKQVEVLQRVFQAQGYECTSVARGDKVFDAAMATSPDVILLDVELPGIDGLTVCRRLKSAVETRLIPVPIMTGG